MKVHIVEAGDWIGAIAAAHGFERWSEIWDHEANAPLREQRGSPDLLMVGDEVAIPEGGRSGVTVATGQRAVFTARGAQDWIRLRVAGLGALVEMMGPVAYELTVGDEVVRGEITEEGQVLEAPLRGGATRAVLVLAGTERREFAIGGLGPVTEAKGVYARLANLGATADPADSDEVSSEAVGDPLTKAVRRFQQRMGLPVDGVIDEATRAALRDAYGG